jgi:hypothetical protein
MVYQPLVFSQKSVADLPLEIQYLIAEWTIYSFLWDFIYFFILAE